MSTTFCKICSQEVATFFDEQMQVTTYWCDHCHFCFKDENNIISLEAEKKVYEQHENSIENAGYVAMFRDFITKTITPYKDEINHVLEFGSGPTPVLSQILTQDGFNVDNYDKFFAPQKVYENKVYDLITSTEVIEHIAEVHALFDFFNQHLRSGGYLALMTQFLPQKRDEYLKWWYRRDPTHISFFTPQALQYLAQQHGFKRHYHDDKKVILLRKI